MQPQYGQSVSGRSAGEEGSASGASPRAGEGQGDVDSSQVMRTAGADDAPGAAMQLTDSQVAAIADAANTAEVEEGRLAERKARDPRVKEFARTMIEHHGQAKADLAKLIPRLNTTPNTSQRLSQLRADAASTRSRLETAPAADFDQQYIDSQIEAHRKVLNALDTELIPNAINPELKAQLQSMRPKVQSHLQQAQSIRQTLGSGGNGHTGSSPGNPGGSDVTK
jgi:putative membrane protein